MSGRRQKQCRTIKDMDADVAIFDILGGTSISVLLIVASRTKSVKTPVVEGLKDDGDRASRRNAKLSFEMNDSVVDEARYYRFSLEHN